MTLFSKHAPLDTNLILVAEAQGLCIIRSTHPPCLSTMHTLAGFLRLVFINDRI